VKTIERCDSHDHANRGKWIITRVHTPTGIPLSDELCPHFHSREQAREALRADKQRDQILAAREERMRKEGAAP
jgi:hypothetical protein